MIARLLSTCCAAAVAGLAVVTPDAGANDFIVENCIDEGNVVSAFYEGGGRVEAKVCTDPGSPGQLQLNGRGGHSGYGEFGAWVWQAPAGAGIVGASINAKLRNAGNWTAQLYAVQPGGYPVVFGTAPASEQFRSYNLYSGDAGPEGVTRVVAQLKCYNGSGCDLNTLGGATTRPDDVQLTVRDFSPPAVSASGQLIEESRWHRGTEPVTVSAADSGAGIEKLLVRIDGQREVQIGSGDCPGDRGAFAVSLQPCGGSRGTSVSFDTSQIGSGTHSIQLCARDYGRSEGNLGCTRAYTVKVDNSVPFQPGELKVAGGEENWHADNRFRLDWTNPSQGSEAPLSDVHHQIRNAAGTIVGSDTRIGGPVTAIEGLSVPNGPGVYTAEVWLEDAAGNQGPPATAKLRFDDARPGDVAPLPISGWVGRNSIPYTVRVSHPAAPQPVSGIHGYAVSIDPAPDADPCAAADRCIDAETDLRGGLNEDSLPLADLSEGTSYVHAVAVSGSGMKSTQAGTAVVHVDTTLPVTGLAGVPAGWTNRPVQLTATAADVLSGMQAAGVNGPFTALRIDGGMPTTAAGDSVSAAVIGEGVHNIAYYARDAAGNVNDGGASNGLANRPAATAVVRIDRNDPAVSFVNSQNPLDPELIEARVSDGESGPDSSRGRISVRRAASAEEFEALPTEASEGRLRARWDSDAYPAGEYEFRAIGYDAAGNVDATDRRSDGAGMVLPNPLKVPTAVHAGFGGRALVWQRCARNRGKRRCRRERIESFDRRPTSRAVPYGRGSIFSGRLLAGLYSPLARMPVQVVEQFEPGSQPAQRVTTVETGADGVFTVHLGPGPSRAVTAVFGGTRTLTRSRGRPVRLAVRSGVRMSASAPVATIGGRPIAFRGKVLTGGAAIPADGQSVQLQFRAPGVPWTEFRTIQTDPLGHFEYGYRFTDDDSRGVLFKFRAVVPTQSDWPYEPGDSRPVAVRGR